MTTDSAIIWIFESHTESHTEAEICIKELADQPDQLGLVTSAARNSSS